MLDENGSRIPDGKGDYVFNADPTTDWGSADTLEFWREEWAVMCNAKFEEKGLDVHIDHRSYKRQGVELLPTVHEDPTVRAMEKKGIKTDDGEFNRWIKATNAFIRNLRKNLSAKHAERQGLFSGLHYCADCGSKLHFATGKNMTASQDCYRCSR